LRGEERREDKEEKREERGEERRREEKREEEKRREERRREKRKEEKRGKGREEKENEQREERKERRREEKRRRKERRREQKAKKERREKREVAPVQLAVYENHTSLRYAVQGEKSLVISSVVAPVVFSEITPSVMAVASRQLSLATNCHLRDIFDTKFRPGWPRANPTSKAICST